MNRPLQSTPAADNLMRLASLPGALLTSCVHTEKIGAQKLQWGAAILSSTFTTAICNT
ncbi:hypothetical protein BJ987_002561 [Nocardia goodfellowii]|uniref:Uncharacterized protein n=1 Tax=Nocardia goodfellowii TaxID=882446 RepID=A0ABS4QDA1_9NOCA|nr:hypothetical protein [Nocardia goodfellowii]